MTTDRLACSARDRTGHALLVLPRWCLNKVETEVTLSAASPAIILEAYWRHVYGSW